jgi:plasmid stabilization system protein ParE
MPDRAVELHREAAAEYDAAFDWYLERSPEAARKFDAEVGRAFTQIQQSPQRWVVGPYRTRKFLLRQFPFTLIYREQRSRETFNVTASLSPTQVATLATG